VVQKVAAPIPVTVVMDGLEKHMNAVKVKLIMEEEPNN